MTVTETKILTAETVPAYLEPFLDKELKDIFSTSATTANNLEAKTIQGGNVNYAFCVTSKDDPTKTVFVKQAPEFVAIFGPDGFPLTSQRMQKEIDVYAQWRALLTDSHAQNDNDNDNDKNSKYLPNIYFFDKTHMVVCMEFLVGFDLLDHILVAPNAASHQYDPKLIANGLGQFMGITHAKTHSSIIDQATRNAYATDYENRPMRDIQLEFVFTKCYNEATDEQRAGLTLTPQFMEQVQSLKQAYDGKKLTATGWVLSHGDLHPGSVMVHKNGQVRVIDPEFTVYGPPGLDVGSLLSGYCLGAIHQAFSGSPDAVTRIIQGAEAIWDSYQTAMKHNGITDAELLRAIENESVGFTVAEVCRTALEFAGGRKWLQFEDAETKARAKKAALTLVENCMIDRHQGGMKLLLDQLRDVATVATTTTTTTTTE